MPQNVTERGQSGFPRAFYCEHSATESRVFVLVDSVGSVPVLMPIFACADRLAAQRAAHVLSRAAQHGRLEVLRLAAELVAVCLSGAAAKSFLEGLHWACAGTWPLEGARPVAWDQVGDEDDALPESVAERSPRAQPVVVRCVETLERRIDDPARLVAAAKAHGWMPDELFADDDPDNLMNAVLLLSEGPDVPGTVTVAASGDGHVLGNNGSQAP